MALYYTAYEGDYVVPLRITGMHQKIIRKLIKNRTKPLHNLAERKAKKPKKYW